MGSYDRIGTRFERVVERAFRGMRDVDQYARFIHFTDDFFPERTETVPFRVSSCRVAYVVTSIVTESDIRNSHFTEAGDVLDVLAYRISVFHS